MHEISRLSIKEVLYHLKGLDFSAEELVKAYIERAERFARLNAYITTTFEQALEEAKLVDREISSGVFRPLSGIPFSVKDNFCTPGVRTTCASKMLSNFVPGYESKAVYKARASGAIMLGKANMDEFAMGSSNLSSKFGPVLNPWAEAFVPGGSSGGSAVSVATRTVAFSLGTDTGGSVRQPAAFTGTVGFKPSYGRISRWGIVPLASSLDQAGVLTSSVEDAALVLSCVMGFDEHDSTSKDLVTDDLCLSLDKSVKGLKIGIPTELMALGVSAAVRNAIAVCADIFAKEGAPTQSVFIPLVKEALSVYYVVCCSEASSNLARYDGIRYGYRNSSALSFKDMVRKSRTEAFGEEVQRRIVIGNYLLSSGFKEEYYVKARKVRSIITQGFEDLFKKVDLILLPTTPDVAFSASDIATENPVEMYKQDIFTVLANLAGLPAVSVPVALSQCGMPVGVQLIGRMYDEKTVLQGAALLERSINTKFIPQGY